MPYHHTVDAFEQVSQVPGHRARLTVFDGGHTIKYGEAFEWLAKQKRDPDPPGTLRLTTDEAKGYFYVDLAPASGMALGRCDVQIGDGGQVSLRTEALREVAIDVAGAGLGGVGSIRIGYASDGACDAVVLTGSREPAAVKTGGEDVSGWRHDRKEGATRIPVADVTEACLEVVSRAN